MKKWFGGMFVLALVMILVLRYSLMGIQPKKQSAYSFFKNHPPNESQKRDSGSIRSSEMQAKKVAKPSIKTPLVNIEGLSDLYASKNLSEKELKALLVWAHLRTLLSRSDALPGTAEGVKEASIAWNDLSSTIEKEKSSKYSNTNSSKDRNCPYSVSTLDQTALNGVVILEIPCGLVEDSSITLVGIPNGQHGSFQIELNTWTSEAGWGKEEKCPAHRSANIVKVDGLVLCNEQIVRSNVEENANVSHPSSDMLSSVSRGSAHGSASFPFVEGNPFTATLWVGIEGFHMTVSGRHETSFAYREKLEPWSVSRVKVTGGLDLLSAFAKGLPVSEDNDLVLDVEHLKAPSVSRKRCVMLVGVFSTGNNFERRMALRRSWMQYEAVRSGDVAVRFFVGLHKNSQVNFELWREAQAYGDVQLMPFVDYYSLIALKTIAICILGTKVLPAKYIMKTDDDAFVRIDEVLSSLKGKAANGLLYGLISFESAPHRDKDSKWYISTEEWPHASYPPWAHGPGYIISRDIAKFIVRGHQERGLKLFKLEDVAMGIWIEQYKKSGQEVHYINDDRFFNAGCEQDYVLAHYQGARKVLCLWEMLQKEHKAICCE
ncbi:hypothetical protein CIPAW_01G132800 [Carya illinoinensis]|uniref:Galectin domain-containing protein n=1 Tax=Carya illinoinensis TaxID=32201 RepID=A0A8T1RL70_CARIL|nr:hypothetical protein CIPAW_01G132800 [Carya illinoinensis]